MEDHQLVLILDFGGQYSQLIARRVRECGVYCEILPCTVSAEEIRRRAPVGILFSGGPNSVYEPGAPTCDPAVFTLGVPVLGICYGHQLMCRMLGGEVVTPEVGEYGKAVLRPAPGAALFEGVPAESVCWMSHTDRVSVLPRGFRRAASTDDCENAAVEDPSRRLFGVQFHPEVRHSEYGMTVLKNFLSVCGAEGDWHMAAFEKTAVEAIRARVGEGRVLLALSGGVDSSVAAALISRAVGRRLTCIFVDHGMLRKNEGDMVERIFTGRFDLDFIRVNAKEQFLNALAGVTDSEQKRKIIGREFLRVFEAEAKKLGKLDFFAQGTIYPDVIESGRGDAAVIKSHHNVGGLPERIGFEGIIEPLRLLFKDEVRALGLQLGLPEDLVRRQPFPGPGLGVRIMGEVTERKLETLREADAIFREEIGRAGLSGAVNQYFAVLTDTSTVGVMGDGRTCEPVVALRAVSTDDFMTADWVRLPYEVLERTAERIVNEVPHTNRIVYDVTSKPPATIEWE